MLILRPPLPHEHGSGTDPWFEWVRSGDGRTVDEHGHSPMALLPRDPERVLVLPAHALSWHPVTLPKVARTRWRMVLEGMLEEQLLADPAEVHLALAPDARPGQPTWACACDRAWLRRLLEALEAGGQPIARIVPAMVPVPDGEPPRHHAFTALGQVWLASAHSDGVALQPLAGAATLTALQAWGLWPPPPHAVWSAEPAAIAQAEHGLPDVAWLPRPRTETLLASVASPWNLAQFDLRRSASAAPRARWRQRLRAWRHEPAWRPARWGLVTLVAALLGNVATAAWWQARDLASRRAAVEAVLRETFPHVSVVLDAPRQMERELQRLRVTSGVAGPHDLETLLAALGRALPDGQSVPTTLDYDGQHLRLGGWPAPATTLATVRDALRAQGLVAHIEGDRLHVEVAQP
jgi:general secretion pathway protein L